MSIKFTDASNQAQKVWMSPEYIKFFFYDHTSSITTQQGKNYSSKKETFDRWAWLQLRTFDEEVFGRPDCEAGSVGGKQRQENQSFNYWKMIFKKAHTSFFHSTFDIILAKNCSLPDCFKTFLDSARR